MLSNEFLVISDNGFKVELIRQMREYPFKLGQKVTLNKLNDEFTPREIFDSVLSDDNKEKILKEAKEALK